VLTAPAPPRHQVADTKTFTWRSRLAFARHQEEHGRVAVIHASIWTSIREFVVSGLSGCGKTTLRAQSRA
jgi:hypothetical protein